MSLATFTVRTRVVAGAGSAASLREEVGRLGARHVAVVADQGLSEAGLLDRVLEGGGLTNATRHRELVGADPGSESAELAARRVAESGCDLIVAIGGGSALGVAKAVAILLANPGPISRYEGSGLVPVLPVPVIAVPTTAGSGSEVSNALVLHDPGREREIIVRGEGCEPRVAILDGTLLRGLPTAPMLFAGLDALTHALESLWARGASSLTSALALAAARSLFEALPVAIRGSRDGSNARGANDATLQRLIEASCQANLACGNSGLGLVHALSSAPAVRLPHGFQNGVLLPRVASFNASAISAEAVELVGRLESLYEDLEFTPAFEPGAADADAMLTASAAHPFRANNLREATDEDLLEILAKAGAVRPGVRVPSGDIRGGRP